MRSNLFVLLLIFSGILPLFSTNQWVMTDKNTAYIDFESLEDYEEINITKSKVSVLFPLQEYFVQKGVFYSCRIAVSDKESFFDQFYNGVSEGDTSSFPVGSGIAGPRSGYTVLTIEEKGNHYLFYDSRYPDVTRVNLLVKRAADYLCEFPFDKIGFRGKTIYSLSEFAGNKLFMIIYIDKNLNKVIEAGEFRRVILNF